VFAVMEATHCLIPFPLWITTSPDRSRPMLEQLHVATVGGLMAERRERPVACRDPGVVVVRRRGGTAGQGLHGAPERGSAHARGCAEVAQGEARQGGVSSARLQLTVERGWPTGDRGDGEALAWRDAHGKGLGKWCSLLGIALPGGRSANEMLRLRGDLFGIRIK